MKAYALQPLNADLHCVIVKTVESVGLTYPRQAALARQDLSCPYLAHRELESVQLLLLLILLLLLLLLFFLSYYRVLIM